MMEQLEMPNISHHIVGERSENDNDELVDIASSTSQSEACVAELEEKLAQLLSDRQRLLDNQSHVGYMCALVVYLSMPLGRGVLARS